MNLVLARFICSVFLKYPTSLILTKLNFEGYSVIDIRKNANKEEHHRKVKREVQKSDSEWDRETY